MTQDRRVLAEGEFVRLVRVGHWEFAERTRARGAVVLIAITNEGHLVLIEQFRVPLGRRVIELPAGLVGDEHGHEDEELLTAARRELVEETGYEARQMKKVASGPPSARMVRRS